MALARSAHDLFRRDDAGAVEGMQCQELRLLNERIHARTLLPHVPAYCAEGRSRPEAATSRIVPFSRAAEGILDPAAKIVFPND
jgi:hypothetical protein